jgi:hypothetical protein
MTQFRKAYGTPETVKEARAKLVFQFHDLLR